MKILLIDGGASYSLKDVSDGYREGLRRAGCEVIYYNLDGRIETAAGWLKYSWDHHRKCGGTLDKPTQADLYYQASIGALERALRFDVDWVVVVSGMYFHPDVAILIRRAGLKVAALLTESPYNRNEEAAFIGNVDVAFTNERSIVGELRKANPQTHYLAHAYSPLRHRPEAADGPEAAAHDVVFVGSGFWERCETLAAVDWMGVDFGLYGEWGLLGPRAALRKHIKGRIVPNATTAALYRNARIGLNLYRTSVDYYRDTPHISGAESLNPRALELAACGAFTLSDYRAEVGEVFGDAVPTFKSPAELQNLVRYYLAHDDERQALAARLPGLVAGHTYDARAQQMVQILQGA